MSDFESAFASHQAGDLQEADRLYQQVLAADPTHADALHLRGVLCLQRGDPGSAVELIARAIDQAPAKAHYHSNLGEAYRLSARLPPAESALRRAIEIDPRHAEAHGNLGVVLRQLGRVGESLDCFRQALSINPDFVEAAMNLGASLRELGELDQAIDVFKEVVDLCPALTAAAVSYGVSLMEAGETTRALTVLQEAVGNGPKDPQALTALGELHLALGDLGSATGCLEQAVVYRPKDADVCYLLADIYLMQERLGDAENSIRTALSLAPETVEYLNLSGWIFRDQGRLDESLATLEKALVLAPANVSVINNRAQTLLELGNSEDALGELRRSLDTDCERADTHNYIGNCLIARGDSEEAVEHFRKAITFDPRMVVAWESLARARKFSSQDGEEILRLEELAKSDHLTDPMKTSIHYALGKIEDDCRNYDRAFGHYHEANQIRGRSVSFDPDRHVESTTRKIAAFDRSLFHSKKSIGSDSDVPVFIVGMLRSGTTLVEQILSSHAQIHAAGELSAFTNVRVAGQLNDTSMGDYVDGIGALTQANVDQLTTMYLSHLTRSGEGCLRATDKMPNNYLHLGLIALLFPRARVVHCRRNPLDNCLSIFFQHLGSLNPYACDLNAIGRYYREYVRLMEHWVSVLPISIHEVSYENLVTDQETTTRAVIDYCGLEWDESCLNYHRNRRAVLTASDWQVHQPIYTGSVERWKRYRTHIGPLKEGLAGLTG